MLSANITEGFFHVRFSPNHARLSIIVNDKERFTTMNTLLGVTEYSIPHEREKN